MVTISLCPISFCECVYDSGEVWSLLADWQWAFVLWWRCGATAFWEGPPRVDHSGLQDIMCKC